MKIFKYNCKPIKNEKDFYITTNREKIRCCMKNHASHWFISDEHIGHGNIIRYCKRPYMTNEELYRVINGEVFGICKETEERMFLDIVKNINRKVKKDDILWHLGDVAKSDKDLEKYLNAIECKNHILIWGNHDLASFKNYFRLTLDQCLLTIRDEIFNEDINIHLNHYPQHTWEGSYKGYWHLYGHAHGGVEQERIKCPKYSYSMDVGVDVQAFVPLKFEEIRDYFRTKDTSFQKYRNELKTKDFGGMSI